MKYFILLLLTNITFAYDGNYYIDVKDLKDNQIEITIQDEVTTLTHCTKMPNSTKELKELARKLVKKFKNETK